MKRSRSIKQEESDLIPHIPSPIISEIISSLPVKTVLGIKSVSKTWLNLISDPNFAKSHFEKSPRGLFLHTESPENVIHFVDLSDGTSRFKIAGDVYIPYKAIMSGFKSTKVDFKICFMSSCNGFLCFSEARSNRCYYVCNPFTRDYIVIPPPKDRIEFLAGDGQNTHRRSEFGFSPRTHQFKVLRFTYSQKAHIFIVGGKSWRSFDVPDNFDPFGTTAYLNGTFHWLCHCGVILSFDLGDESFHEFPFPHQFGSDHTPSVYHYSMGVLEECISICCGNYDLGKIEIWKMEEYGVKESWTKHFVIEDPSKFLNYLRVRWLMEDGEKVLLVCSNNVVVTYDPVVGGCRYLKFEGLWDNISICPHVPSLISLKSFLMVDRNSKLKEENEVGLPGEIVESKPTWIADGWCQPKLTMREAYDCINFLKSRGEYESQSRRNFSLEISIMERVLGFNYAGELSRRIPVLRNRLLARDNEVAGIRNYPGPTNVELPIISDDGDEVGIVDAAAD